MAGSFLKWILVWLFIAAFLLIGLSYAIPFFSKESNTDKEPTTKIDTPIATTTTKDNKDKNAVVLATFVEDPAVYKQCEFAGSDVAGTANGNVYIGNGMFKGEFEFNPSYPGAVAVTSYTQNDGEYTYVWTKGSTEGFKIESEYVDPDLPAEEAINIYQPGNYTCRDWEFDASVFVIPKDVIFQQNVITI
jgi:hypothetical protein